MTLSVVIPSCRGRDRLASCLDSVSTHQLGPSDVDLIVVLNGPDDGSAEEIASWQTRHPTVQLTVLTSPVASVTAARNLGLSHAVGEWVTFVDDDDRVTPGYFAALLNTVRPGAIGIAPGARVFDHGWQSPDWTGDMAAGPLRWAGREGSVGELGRLLRPVWGKVVATEWARAVGFDDALAGYGDDTIFWLRIVERFAPTLRVSPAGREGAYLYQVRSGGITGFGRTPQWRSHVVAVIAMLQALDTIAPGQAVEADPDLRALCVEMAAAPYDRILEFAHAHPERATEVREALARLGDSPPQFGHNGSGGIAGTRTTDVTTPHEPVPPSPSGRRFLAIFRSGPKSLHPKLTSRLAEQNFDYALSWYGDTDPETLAMADGAVFVHHVRGQKWPGLVATLAAHADQIAAYDYVWFPDDDLLCEPETVSRFFAVISDLGLDLAQPALTHGSGFVHQIVLQHPSFQLRFTNFVELMCPAMSREMLQRAKPSMENTLSGWGVDGLWPRLTTVGKVAIVDDTVITHTRPILGGDGYQANTSAGIPMAVEEAVAFERYGIRREQIGHLNYGGLLADGSTICLGGPHPGQPSALVGHLLDSLARTPSNSLKIARYLGNHADFLAYDDHKYLPAVLNTSLAGTGLWFED